MPTNKFKVGSTGFLNNCFNRFKVLRKLSTQVILAIAALILLLSISTLGLLTVNKTISSTGTVKKVNVDVFSDSVYTQPLNLISWGSISPGKSITKTIFIKNTGTLPVTLSMATNGWVPSAANGPITITWNKEDELLSTNQSIGADLTLSVSPSIIGITSFSVNIVITGTG